MPSSLAGKCPTRLKAAIRFTAEPCYRSAASLPPTRQRQTAFRARQFPPAPASPNPPARYNPRGRAARRQRSRCAAIDQHAALRSPPTPAPAPCRTARLSASACLRSSRAQIHIARTQRQAVRLAHNGANHNLRAQSQICCHAPSTATCAASFCPKKARSGSAAINSFATTVATPRKCPGRECAVQPIAQALDLDKRRRTRRIQFLNRRSKDHVQHLQPRPARNRPRNCAGSARNPRWAQIAWGSQRCSRPRRSQAARAARISDACPACSAPIVGTRPIRCAPPSFDRRRDRDQHRSSSTVRRISIARASAFPFLQSVAIHHFVFCRFPRQPACPAALRVPPCSGGSSRRQPGRRDAPRPRDSARSRSETARLRRHIGAQTWPPAQRSGSPDRGTPESAHRNRARRQSRWSEPATRP